MLKLTLIIINSSCFPSDTRYIYTLILKFSDLSVSKSSSASISDISKDIVINIFPKLIKIAFVLLL